jgi:hypothetical protein
MRSILTGALAVSLFAFACSERTKDSPTSDGGDCGCRVEGSDFNAELVMSWSCYCAAYGDGCTRTLPDVCTDYRQRFEYPACGMTLLRFVPAGGPIEDVFDADGKLVGARVASDLLSYACPSDPSKTAFKARAGQFPAATCAEVACGACDSSSTSCGAVDGSAGQ